MKKLLGVLAAIVIVIGFTSMTEASDRGPTALTDAQMAQIVAGGGAPGHQRAAADLKGDVAGLMPGHVLGLEEGEGPGDAHQSKAAVLKGGVADLVPGHVRRNQ